MNPTHQSKFNFKRGTLQIKALWHNKGKHQQHSIKPLDGYVIIQRHQDSAMKHFYLNNGQGKLGGEGGFFFFFLDFYTVKAFESVAQWWNLFLLFRQFGIYLPALQHALKITRKVPTIVTEMLIVMTEHKTQKPPHEGHDNPVMLSLTYTISWSIVGVRSPDSIMLLYLNTHHYFLHP